MPQFGVGSRVVIAAAYPSWEGRHGIIDSKMENIRNAWRVVFPEAPALGGFYESEMRIISSTPFLRDVQDYIDGELRG
jgi:hypothetical protein